MLRILTAAIALMSAGAALAAEPQLSMTIYNSNLALVEDVRTIDIPAGRQRIEFKDVSAGIRPETVALSIPSATIIEQNFDYDLLSPDKLMEKAVGQQVRIVRTNPGTGAQVTETATVLAVNNGVVLKIGNRIEVLRDDGVPTRVIFDKVPDNLRARPTLSVTVNSATPGPREVRLRYLTTGLSWRADYVTVFDEKAGKLDLQGWITLTNTAGTTFRDADARLVAGDVNLTTDGRPRPNYRRPQTSMAHGGSGGDGDQVFADYYVYPLPQRTTVAQNQTKQVSFVEAKGAVARKVYRYESDSFSSGSPQHADVVVEFSNARESGLGSQLPAGIVRVYVRDVSGEPKFIGEDSIDHTPQGSELQLKTGEAFDVTVQRTLVSQERISSRRTRYTMRYVVANARAQPAVVDIQQNGLWNHGRVVRESQKSRRVDASTLSWDVPVPPNGEAELNVTVETD